MEYTVNKLAKLSGVSTRTLRYYDQIELLKPSRICSNGYRVYGKNEIDALQQILFYRELGVNLNEIKKLLTAPNFDREKSLQIHLNLLQQKKIQIEVLIKNVSKTIESLKGETIMSDKEKFEGFKQKLINDNEQNYGDEIRKKYGDDAVYVSNAKLKTMNEKQWQQSKALSDEINETLKIALKEGNPANETAQKACDLHRQWLCIFWKDGAYSKEAHRSLGDMYVDDERFKKYYDNIADGAAVFLRDAINIYCTT